MKNTLYRLTTVLLIFSIGACSQAIDNKELQKMYDEDQKSRMTDQINWLVLVKKDSIRERRVYEMIGQNKVKTAKDYYNSAMIFQHGPGKSSSSMAVKQMRKAIELDSNINRWLLAAAIDRDLMNHSKPQIYGTQYIQDYPNVKWRQYEIDTTKITDAERRYYNVETLAQQKVKEHNMNLKSISLFYAKSKSINNTLALIKAENKRGQESEYSVIPAEVNSFGYELMQANKNQEALKVFRLNTELYPDAYNTFDSYGECLLKLKRTEEATKAYEKVLQLNPTHKNAIKVLAELKSK